jgi:hypothetical protein
MKAARIREFGGLAVIKLVPELLDMSTVDQIAKPSRTVIAPIAIAAVLLPVRAMINLTEPLKFILGLGSAMTGGGIAFAVVLTDAWLGTGRRDGPARRIFVVLRILIPRRIRHS